MGEVRVKVKLTNLKDQYLAEEGEMPPQSVRFYEVDTGAVRCVLPPFVANQLGLTQSRSATAQLADGRIETFPITSAFLLEVFGRIEEENAFVMGDEVLIGQTALEKMDLLVDCNRQQLIPNPAHPDQPINKVK